MRSGERKERSAQLKALPTAGGWDRAQTVHGKGKTGKQNSSLQCQRKALLLEVSNMSCGRYGSKINLAVIIWTRPR